MEMTLPRPSQCTDALGRPESIRIGPPIIRSDDGVTGVVFPVSLQAGDGPAHFHDSIGFRVHATLEAGHIGMEAGLAACLVPAMATRRDIVVDGPLSPMLRESAGLYQSIYSTWNKNWRKGMISGAASELKPGTAPLPERSSAMFFSGGVDSMYTLLRLRDQVTHLVYITGFDTPPEHQAHAEIAVANARSTAADNNLGFILVETDARKFGDR